MAKLKVDEIETTSTNQDLKVITKGSTGAVEVKKGQTGQNGTLQLNCSAQSHGVKLKAPPDSAGQSYTMAMPDNQIAASKLLKVKSVTNNSAQLEYGDVPTAASVLVNLDAQNLTSGTLPSSAFPTFPASAGAGLKLAYSSKVTTDNSIQQIDLTGIAADKMYYVIIRNMTAETSGGSKGFPIMQFLDSSNNPQTYVEYNKHYYANSYTTAGGSSTDYVDMRPVDYNFYSSTAKFNFNGYLSTHANHNDWIILKGHSTGFASETHIEIFAAWTSSQRNNRSINGLRFLPRDYYLNTNLYFQSGTEILIYQLMES